MASTGPDGPVRALAGRRGRCARNFVPSEQLMQFDGARPATYTSASGGLPPGWPVRARTGRHRAVAQLARVPVSKTGGWGFESLLPCECGSCEIAGEMAASAGSGSLLR